MRKFLSLVLALVMMMSLVTINAGAKEFTDGDDITYQEAVDVISTIKVVDGYADGDFKPGNNLTRGAAAKIICNLILGPTTAAELHADTAPYRDVAVTNDFAGYIAYCQKEGIISGYADGTFRPAGTLTGYAFMKMLLGALGYDAEVEGYTGPNWSINVAKRAIGIGLNKSLEKTFNGVEYVTREEAALYAFNTLKADLVEYDTKITATVNGAEVAIGNNNAKPQEWDSQQTRRNNIYDDTIVQFAEQYFNKLVLTEAMDCFGRPDREWKYDGDEIGAYLNMDLFKEEYTTEVTGKDLRDLLGGTVVDEYHFEIHVDGEETKEVLDNAFFSKDNLIRTNTKGVGRTGKGVLTQVFVDSDKDVETVWISVINTYLAKATDDYNEKKDEVHFDVWHLTDALDAKGKKLDALVKADDVDYQNGNKLVNLKVIGDDFDIADYKESDIVLVRVAENEIKEILDPEVINETSISSFKLSSNVTAEGTQYDYANTAWYDDEVLDQYADTNMKDTTYRIFLDPYGYLIGLEIVEGEDLFLFLTGIDTNTSNLKDKKVDGNVIFTDGTSDVVTIDLKESRTAQNTKFTAGPDYGNGLATDANPTNINSLMNTWCKYSVDEKGVYTLTEIANTKSTMEAKGNKYGQSHMGGDYIDTDSGNAVTNYNTEDATNVTTAKYCNDEYVTIDKKHVSLAGIAASDGYKRVYGNSATIYLSAETDLLTTTAHAITAQYAHAVVITGADSVSVGVQDVDINAWNAGQVVKANSDYTADGRNLKLKDVSDGVYTLFNDKGYVVAAVVVGEDNGTNTQYAWVHTDNLNKEAYGGSWTYERDVLIDAKEATLTEEETSGTTRATIDTAFLAGDEKISVWWEVRTKADGTVKEAKRISTPGTYSGYQYVDDIDDIPTSTKDTVVLNQLFATGDAGVPFKVRVTGNTLQVESKTGDVRGFAVSANANIAVVKDDEILKNGVHAGWDWKNDVDYFTNNADADGLKRAVASLVDNKDFRGYVAAVLDGGLATCVVIYDKTANDVETGGDTTPAPEGGNADKVALYSVDGKLYVDSSITDTTEQASAIRAWLDANNYEDVDVQIKAGKITAKGSKGGVTYTWSDDSDNTIVDTQALVAIKVDGADVTVPANATVSDVTGVASNAANFVMETSTGSNVPTATNGAVVADEDYGTVGYVVFTTPSLTLAETTTFEVTSVGVANANDKVTVGSTTYIKIGATVRTTLTAKIDVTNAGTGTTISAHLKIVSTGATYDTTGTAYTGWDKTTAGQLIDTAANAGTEEILKTGETVVLTYTVAGGAAFAQPNTVTVTKFAAA